MVDDGLVRVPGHVQHLHLRVCGSEQQRNFAAASEAIAAPYRMAPTAIVYRPFVEPPIPCWLALVWRLKAPSLVHDLVAVARTLPGMVQDNAGAQIA